MEKIKVIIADDNKTINNIIRKNLEAFKEIEILGSAYSDEDEINLINSKRPEIVITDLVRNNTQSGLEIIKKCKRKDNMPKFLTISAGGDESIDTNIMDGFIKKPLVDYNVILQELKRIKMQIEYERLSKTVTEPIDKLVKNKFIKKFKKSYIKVTNT